MYKQFNTTSGGIVCIHRIWSTASKREPSSQKYIWVPCQLSIDGCVFSIWAIPHTSQYEKHCAVPRTLVRERKVSTTDTHTHTKRSTRAHANKKNASQSQLYKPMMVWIHISYTRPSAIRVSGWWRGVGVVPIMLYICTCLDMCLNHSSSTNPYKHVVTTQHNIWIHEGVRPGEGGSCNVTCSAQCSCIPTDPY